MSQAFGLKQKVEKVQNSAIARLATRTKVPYKSKKRKAAPKKKYWYAQMKGKYEKMKDKCDIEGYVLNDMMQTLQNAVENLSMEVDTDEVYFAEQVKRRPRSGTSTCFEGRR